jgi:hypothetical protein
MNNINTQTRLKQFFIFVLVGLTYSCNSSDKNYSIESESDKTITLEPIDKYGNLFMETEESDSTDDDNLNLDNHVYPSGKKYIFSYSFTRNGKRFCSSDFGSDWELVSCSEMDLNHTIALEVAKGNPMKKYMQDYRQSSIKYYYSEDMYNMTGLIENHKNIWMHPPRAGMFELLEIMPFPFVQFPIKKGKEYKWFLKIGDHYSHPDLIK